jgi:predicted MFS family arabinose efflux permease
VCYMEQSNADLFYPSKLTVYALGLSRYAPRGATLVVGVLMIEIGATFSLPVGVVNKMNATHSLLSLLTALAMGVISIKFGMELLLFAGLGLALVSAIGSCLSPSFQLLFFLYSLNGVAWSLVYPMSIALVGDIFPQEKRTDALSKILAIPPIITVFGSPFVGYIGDWRMALVLYAIPIAVASLILTRFSIPTQRTKGKRIDLLSAFKTLITNKSALSCLMYFLLNSIAFHFLGMLSISFLREHHSLPKGATSLIYSCLALANFIGALAGGKIANRYGRKLPAVFITLTYGLSVVLFVTVSNMYIAIALGIFAGLLGGLREPAINSLTIEQIPEIRGSIMSLSSASDNVGGMIGAAVAGFLLLSYGWIMAGVFLGSAAIMAGLILQFFVKDPTAHLQY